MGSLFDRCGSCSGRRGRCWRPPASPACAVREQRRAGTGLCGGWLHKTGQKGTAAGPAVERRKSRRPSPSVFVRIHCFAFLKLVSDRNELIWRFAPPFSDLQTTGPKPGSGGPAPSRWTGPARFVRDRVAHATSAPPRFSSRRMQLGSPGIRTVHGFCASSRRALFRRGRALVCGDLSDGSTSA